MKVTATTLKGNYIVAAPAGYRVINGTVSYKDRIITSAAIYSVIYPRINYVVISTTVYVIVDTAINGIISVATFQRTVRGVEINNRITERISIIAAIN